MSNADHGHWPAPVARSYDGELWESLYPLPGQSRVAISCTEAACALTLPPETPSGYAYRIDEYNASSVEGLQSTSPTQLRRKKAAKFLTQGTFGPKREELDAMTSRLGQGTEEEAFAGWVEEQIALPSSSHRGFFRERVNSRANVGRLACEAGSRWHRFSFTTEDVLARVNITVTIDSASVRSIFVDNVLRTQIRDFGDFDPTNILNVSVGQPWYGYLCRVGERVGGWQGMTHWGWHHRGGIGLDPSPTCIRNAANHLQFHHPPLDFVTPDATTTLMLDANEATLEAIPTLGRTFDRGHNAHFVVGGDLKGASVGYDEVYIMTRRDGPCTLSRFNQERRGHGFLIYDGTTCERTLRMLPRAIYTLLLLLLLLLLTPGSIHSHARRHA